MSWPQACAPSLQAANSTLDFHLCAVLFNVHQLINPSRDYLRPALIYPSADRIELLRTVASHKTSKAGLEAEAFREKRCKLASDEATFGKRL